MSFISAYHLFFFFFFFNDTATTEIYTLSLHDALPISEDSSGYPDCRPEYYRVFQELIRVGTRPETQIAIVTPVITLKKSEIIQRGIGLGAPLHLTWSCYQNEDSACGACDSCLLRLRAFAEAGVPDPLPYRRTVSAGQ